MLLALFLSNDNISAIRLLWVLLLQQNLTDGCNIICFVSHGHKQSEEL